MKVRHLLRFLGTVWVNWRKTKETTSFILKLCFFISKWKYQFAKRYWCCEVWRSEHGKTVYKSNHISKNVVCYIYQKNYCSTLFLFLFVCFFSLVLLWECFSRFWLIHLHYFSNRFLLSPWMQSLSCSKKRSRTYLKIFQNVKFKFLQ